MDLRCLLLFAGNNRQHTPVCVKMTSTWARKVYNIAKTDMSLGTLHAVVASATLVAGISFVSILQAVDWARISTSATHYFLSISLQTFGTICGLSPVCCSGPQQVNHFGNCRTLTCINLVDILGCWAMALPSTEQIVPQLYVHFYGIIALECKAQQPNILLLRCASKVSLSKRKSLCLATLWQGNSTSGHKTSFLFKL